MIRCFFIQRILEQQHFFYEILNENINLDSGKFDWGITTSQSYLPLDNSNYFIDNTSLVDWLR